MTTPPTTPDIPPSLLQPLRAHVDFIGYSSDAYDNGYQAEVKRFATSMRALLHEALPFRSLMNQVGGLHGKFISTVLPRETENLSKHGGLIRAALLDGRAIYYAPLDRVWHSHWLTFPEWWNEIVFIDDQRMEVSRRDMILSVADKEAGSNVDPNLSAAYAELSQHESFGWIEKLGGPTSSSAERAAARQIVHETLATLIPLYRKTPKPTTDPRLAAAMQKADERPPSLGASQGPSRNGPCPCGSSKRFKNCHGTV
jgi:hypothetical protein